MARLDRGVAVTVLVDDSTRPPFPLGPQVEVVLEELAQQGTAVDVEVILKLVVGEARGLWVSEETDEAPIAGVGGREGLAQPRRLRRPTNDSRPALPSASSRWRAAR
jgi:hypothetical protein